MDLETIATLSDVKNIKIFESGYPEDGDFFSVELLFHNDDAVILILEQHMAEGHIMEFQYYDILLSQLMSAFNVKTLEELPSAIQGVAGFNTINFGPKLKLTDYLSAHNIEFKTKFDADPLGAWDDFDPMEAGDGSLIEDDNA